MNQLITSTNIFLPNYNYNCFVPQLIIMYNRIITKYNKMYTNQELINIKTNVKVYEYIIPTYYIPDICCCGGCCFDKRYNNMQIVRTAEINRRISLQYGRDIKIINNKKRTTNEGGNLPRP